METKINSVIYTVEKECSASYYRKLITDNNGCVIADLTAHYPIMTASKDRFKYIILYDDDMKVVPEAYEFLNHNIRDFSLTTRKQYAYAIRILYCFLSLSNSSVYSIDYETLRKLIAFLRGIGISDTPGLIKRSNQTVNLYLSVYRTFFQKRDIHCPALFASASRNVDMFFEEEVFNMQRLQYKNNLRASKDTQIPKYISPEVFSKVYSAAIRDKNRQAQIIMHLMYGYGMRLGEVLGLTLEDICETVINSKPVPYLIIRNRLSDKPYQYAKNLMHIHYPSEYKSGTYINNSQKIYLTYHFYEDFLDFIEDSHLKARNMHPEMYQTSIADCATGKMEQNENHYVFVNRFGKPLSGQTWGNTLKRYFEEAGIPLDKNTRENNLSHRFRHGFAMFHARYSAKPVDALMLQKMMRHKTIASTLVYYNPTPEDEFKTKTEFQKELYEKIPELSKPVIMKGTE